MHITFLLKASSRDPSPWVPIPQICQSSMSTRTWYIPSLRCTLTDPEHDWLGMTLLSWYQECYDITHTLRPPGIKQLHIVVWSPFILDQLKILYGYWQLVDVWPYIMIKEGLCLVWVILPRMQGTGFIRLRISIFRGIIQLTIHSSNRGWIGLEVKLVSGIEAHTDGDGGEALHSKNHRQIPWKFRTKPPEME